MGQRSDLGISHITCQWVRQTNKAMEGHGYMFEIQILKVGLKTRLDSVRFPERSQVNFDMTPTKLLASYLLSFESKPTTLNIN